MDKRGQIYILVAILFGFTLFILTSKMNYAVEKGIEDDFKELSENYAIESSKFVNSLLENKIVESSAVFARFVKFTEKFSKFALNQNPNFGLIFLLPYKSSLYTGNYVEEIVDFGGRRIKGCGGIRIGSSSIDGASMEMKFASNVGDNDDCVSMLPFTDRLSIIIGKMKYEFKVNEDAPEVIIVSKEDIEEQRKVFMNNQIISGEVLE